MRRFRCLLAIPILAALSGFGLIGAGPAAAVGVSTHCPAAPRGVHSTAPGTGRTVALTFDDGPGRSTTQIMHILAANHVTATFFNLGDNEVRDPDIVKAEQRSGYLLGDHTWDHADLRSLTAAEQDAEITRERDEQASLTGMVSCVFRPPYGSYNSTTEDLAVAKNLAIWNWSVDTEDWKAAGSPSEFWVNRIESRAIAGENQQHPVILMHNQPNGNPATVSALPGIIASYRARGYQFVDVHGNTGPPSVHSATPSNVPTQGGTRILVRGHNFRSVRSVRVGGILCTGVDVVSPTALWASVPNLSPGRHFVSVSTDHWQTAQSTGAEVRAVAPPVITGLSDATSPLGGTGVITVTGTSFIGLTRVFFGATPATSVQLRSSTSLRVRVPAHAAGRVDVRVSTAYGTSGAAAFRYVSPPRVTAVAPTSVAVAGGDTVTITGLDFGSTPSVQIGGLDATVSAASTTSITVTTPAHPAGVVEVIVRTGYGVSVPSAADHLTYLDPPAGGSTSR